MNPTGKNTEEKPFVQMSPENRKYGSMVANATNLVAESLPLLFDETSSTNNAWNIKSVPTVAYIDPHKQIAYHGRALWADVATAVEAADGLPQGTVRFSVKGTKAG